MISDDSSKQHSVLIDKAVEHAFGLSERTTIFSDKNLPVRYCFFPTWRSRLGGLLLFLFSAFLAIRFSHEFTSLIVHGELFTIGSTRFIMNMPILMFVPGYFLARVLLFVYNSRYVLDEHGVEAQTGLVALRLRQIRLKYEDIRGVKTSQSILDRILNIGVVEIGSAMTGDVEIRMLGVYNPKAIQILICKERDKRLKTLAGGGHAGHKVAMIDIDTRD